MLNSKAYNENKYFFFISHKFFILGGFSRQKKKIYCEIGEIQADANVRAFFDQESNFFLSE